MFSNLTFFLPDWHQSWFPLAAGIILLSFFQSLAIPCKLSVMQIGYDRNRMTPPETGTKPTFLFRLTGTRTAFINSGSGLKPLLWTLWYDIFPREKYHHRYNMIICSKNVIITDTVWYFAANINQLWYNMIILLFLP